MFQNVSSNPVPVGMSWYPLEVEETTFRPRTLDDYVGQKRLKEKFAVYLEATKNRGDALDHVLLYGPPGLGKTTLAHIIGVRAWRGASA